MKRFHAMIDKCAGAPARERKKCERELWEKFGAEKTVMILDMSGFTVTVQRGGLVEFLLKIRAMHRVVRRELRRHHGRLVKFEADNAYAVFDNPADAARAAVAMVEYFRGEREPEVSLSIGIAHGSILLVPRQDFFGDAVNLAGKLGEDLAGRDEILIDEKAVTPAMRHEFKLQKIRFNVSGVRIRCYQVMI
ncbi:adenylate/guanylate cyclase domain-containing protein [Oscillatoria amoena NRMC-F 0135]|nr:adenylate/guanylate cyclase domain-containing protein [Oscillatoria amoena NRMC-F 0135]